MFNILFFHSFPFYLFMIKNQDRSRSELLFDKLQVCGCFIVVVHFIFYVPYVIYEALFSPHFVYIFCWITLQYYLKTGTCKFGATCKFHHPRDKAGIAGRVSLNILGYPLRSVRISISLTSSWLIDFYWILKFMFSLQHIYRSGTHTYTQRKRIIMSCEELLFPTFFFLAYISVGENKTAV